MTASSPAALQPLERRQEHRISAIEGSPEDLSVFMVGRQAHPAGPGAEAGMGDGAVAGTMAA
jgi:hypothetical protein